MINLPCLLKELWKNTCISYKNVERERTRQKERGGEETGHQTTAAIFA